MDALVMDSDRPLKLERRTRTLAQWVGVGLCAMSCAVFIGWVFGIHVLTHLWSAEASMKLATAFGFLLGGSALVLLAGRACSGRCERAAMGLAALMMTDGVVCLVSKSMGWSSAFGPEHGISVVLLLPSWATAASLLLGGVSLLTIRTTHGWMMAVGRVTTLAVGLIAGVALMAYVLGVADLYGVEPFRTMAFHTAAGFFILSVGVCLAQPGRGVVALLLRNDAGGVVARQLLPAVLVAPLVVAAVVEWAGEAGLFGPRLALGIVVVLVVVGGVFAIATTAMNLSVSDRRRQESERRNRMMLAELDHRVKNTMAAVLSMCEQTAVGCRSIDEFKRTYRGRLQAMARAHDALAATKWQGVSLKQMISTVVGAYSFIDGRALEVTGDEMVVPSSAALPLAVTLNELATNAVKHGAWSNAAAVGRVQVTWRVSGNDWLEVDWAESGGPIPVVMPNGGFGLSLIRGMIPHEMGGTVELIAGPTGLTCRLRLSLHEAELKTEAKYSLAS